MVVSWFNVVEFMVMSGVGVGNDVFSMYVN